MPPVTTIAAAADVQLIVQVLTWAALGLGGSLIACIIWFLMRVLHQFDNVIEQVALLKGLVQDDIHRHDIRITKLESWREAMIQANQTQRILELAKKVHSEGKE